MATELRLHHLAAGAAALGLSLSGVPTAAVSKPGASVPEDAVARPTTAPPTGWARRSRRRRLASRCLP
jgi:hypothetical protein